MDDEILVKAKIWGLPVENACSKLGSQIIGVDRLFIFPSNGKSSGTTLSSKKGGGHFVKRVSWVWNDHQRSLANEVLPTFVSLQKASADGANDNLFFTLVRKSREYRSKLQACASEMKQFLERETLPPDQYEDINANWELFYKMELVLGLVEIIFLDNRSGCPILNQLLGWIKLHFPQSQIKLSECLSRDNPYMHADYWDTFYGLILQGCTEDARKLLSTHPDKNTDPFLSIDELLRKMPVYVVYSGVTEAEFTVRWQHWQSECENRLQVGEFTTCKKLETACKILCGDLQTMVSLSDVLDTWYHLMVSYQLFTNPTIKLHRLPAAAQESVSSFGMESQISRLDQLLLAILEVDGHQVVKQTHLVLDNVWFTAHLCDLLYHAGKGSNSSGLMDIRETLLIDYGSELVSHESLWQVGLVYLDYSGKCTAGPMVEAVLERLPLTDNAKALKVTQAAFSRGMDHVAHGVCRVMGRRALALGQLGSAIWWGVKSRDSYFTSHLAHKILHKYMSEGRFDSSSLLEHLGPDMLLSDTLTFLSKYREFHSLYQEGKLKEAASLLVSLVASKMAPEYFWPVLLEDALPLLQVPTPVFTTEQTYNLLYCLQNIKENIEQNVQIEKNVISSFFEREGEVRLALMHNLAKAIVREGTIDR